MSLIKFFIKMDPFKTALAPIKTLKVDPLESASSILTDAEIFDIGAYGDFVFFQLLRTFSVLEFSVFKIDLFCSEWRREVAEFRTECMEWAS